MPCGPKIRLIAANSFKESKKGVKDEHTGFEN